MSAKQIILPLVGIVALAGAAYAGYSYGVKGGTLPFLGGDQASEIVSDAPVGDDPVMAKVGDIEIRRSEVVKFAESIPNIPQEQIDLILPELVGQVVDLKLITKEATTSGLENDPEVQKRVGEVKERILVEIFLNRALEKEVTDEAVEKAYQDYLTENPAVREVSARHILVEKEETGKDLIKQLDEGADFATLAKEHSTGPSGPGGGDLGFFKAEQMVKPFSDAAFGMKVGEHSTAPVQTRFGWHVIKVDDERDSEQPTKEQLDGQLRSELSRSAYEGIVDNLKDGVQIEIIGAETDEAAPVETENEEAENEEKPASE
ncbi:peptidylprolyl isomerase [Kiloniella sp. EL199]|uniref:peptidylprolyl isomerase n=1 Tax=Kiloniella sp. EL199 TaxID=2107581 RepID=UPI000EA1AADF|nr:peptidylprolyl isomerase [Kiloniella sp. EL199]